MPTIVNLSTIHDYSIEKTMDAFLKICNTYSHNLPDFFAPVYNYAWLRVQFFKYYASHIEPYKLGGISTDTFYDNLTEILNFLPKDMEKSLRNKLLEDAWNSSITISEQTKGRLLKLVDMATEENPVYMISNTNELNAQSILVAFRESYPILNFHEDIDLSIKKSKEPVEILPNVFLCLSYRYQMFKTDSMLEEVVKSKGKNTHFTVVSQYEVDRNKATELQVEKVSDPGEFFENQPALALR